MAAKKDPASAALIGDLVASRNAPDRRRVHARLVEVLDAVNETARPLSPLRITVGDEYQGLFATVGDAVAASLVLRVSLLPVVDVRHGIGWGVAETLSTSPLVEDGPAWWAARDAIEAAEGWSADRRCVGSVRVSEPFPTPPPRTSGSSRRR